MATTTHNSISGNAVINGSVAMVGRVENMSMTLTAPDMTPRQMPAPVKTFVNRSSELERLRSVAEALRDSREPGVVVLSGLGGVGKTQLVAQWVARALAPDYPGGHLYVDLDGGRRDGGADVEGALAGCLRALGVHRDFLPNGLGERAGMFRSHTSERGDVLVVVDNARQAAEVRPFIPSRGLLVVTSRTGLPALAVDGAVPITVDPLDERAGVELLRRWRAAGADDAAQTLVRLCSGLPLALHALGVWLMERSHLSLDDAVNVLGGTGVPPGEDGTTSVKTVLDMAYDVLPDHAKELYRLLGCLPGTTVTGGLAAAAGVPAVEDAVGKLLTAHLMVSVPSPARPRRFRPHDAVREHARQTALRLPEADRRALLRAVSDFYLAAASHADVLVLGPLRLRLQPSPTRSLDELSPGERLFTDSAEALEWLDAERVNLLALLRTAADERWDDIVWQLCESLWALFDGRKHHGDSIEAHALGIEAAGRCGRADAEVRMRNQLARAHYGLGAYGEARQALDPAEQLLDEITDARLRGMVRETQGLIALALGAHDDAHTLFTEALDANSAVLEANSAARDVHGVVVQTYNIGQALLAAGRPDEALDVLGDARATAAGEGDHGMLPRIDIVRAQALRLLDRPQAASEVAIRAAEQANERGQYARLDRALGILSELAASTSDTELRAACDAKLRELHRSAGVQSGDD
ncbi:ATP-binding protein [Streptomyces sp. SID13726]|nr:tetratricopeptide repeat protein [Streptomyces sp. SID13726]NEB00927.1 ATP-binding protein [Streptomyces sp. SID13726]